MCLCRAICSKRMQCGHPCPDICHVGPCAPCQEVVAARCACGEQQSRRPCYLADWHCEKTCGKLLACGRHTCDQVGAYFWGGGCCLGTQAYVGVCACVWGVPAEGSSRGSLATRPTGTVRSHAGSCWRVGATRATRLSAFVVVHMSGRLTSQSAAVCWP